MRKGFYDFCDFWRFSEKDDEPSNDWLSFQPDTMSTITISFTKRDMFAFLDNELDLAWDEEDHVIYMCCTANHTVEDWLSEWVAEIEKQNPSYDFDYEFDASNCTYRVEWIPTQSLHRRNPIKHDESVEIVLTNQTPSRVIDCIIGQRFVVEEDSSTQ